MSHDYITRTRAAVTDLFEAQSRSLSLLRASLRAGAGMAPYLPYKVSVDALSGSILQIAYMGVSLLVRPPVFPDTRLGPVAPIR